MWSLRKLLQFVPDGREAHLFRQFNLEIGRKASKPPSARLLAECLGFAVEERELPNSELGFLEHDTFAQKGYLIVVNKNMSVLRKRWTVLHELAHYYLHIRPKAYDPFMPRKNRAGKSHWYGSNEVKEEREADAFAEALCFSDGSLEAAIADADNDIQEIANRFGLSLEAVTIAIRKCSSRR